MLVPNSSATSKLFTAQCSCNDVIGIHLVMSVGRIDVAKAYARPRVTFRRFYLQPLPNLNISYHQDIPRNCITLSSAFKPCKQGGFRIRFKQKMTRKTLLEQPKDSASNHCFKKVSFSVHCFRFLSIRRDGFPTTKKPTSSAKITGSSESDVDGSKSTSSRQRFTIQSDVNHDVAVNSPRWVFPKIRGTPKWMV